MMMNVLRFVGSLELEFLIKIQESGEIQDRIWPWLRVNFANIN